jgi:hypothetical protein
MYELERGGLVTGERSQHHLIGGRTDWWWRLTERAWLKLAASGEYSDGDHDPLSSDYPPIARAVAHVVRTNPRTSAEIIDALLAGGGKLPPDDETIWPHFSGRPNRSADGHRAALGELVERRIGHLVLDGVLQPTSEDQSPVRWALTDSGRTQLGA